MISFDARREGQPWPPSKKRLGGGSLRLHRDVKTTMVYIYVLNRGLAGVRVLVDGL